MTKLTRWGALTAVMGLAWLSSVALIAPGAVGAPKAACSNFAATAAADGVRSGVASPGFLLVEQADVQGPAAQAVVNGLGQSSAFAGAPYPGDTVMSAIGLVGADPDSYPLAVSSQYPGKPSGATDNPALSLSAASAERSSSAAARGGGSTPDRSASAGATTADAKAECRGDGSVRATAESGAEMLNFSGGVLRVGRVHSEARAIIGSSGETRLESRLAVGEITVVGQTVALTEKGLQAAGSSTPVPDNPVLQPLKEAGIEVSYVKATKDPDGKGVRAPGMKVELTRDAVGTAPTVVTYTFGRAYARAGSAPDDTLAVSPPPSPATPVGGSGTAVADPPADSSVSAADGAPIGAPIAAPAAAPQPPPPAIAEPAQRIQQTAAFGGPEFTSEALYLSVTAGAALALLGGLSLRIFGVRLGWT